MKPGFCTALLHFYHILFALTATGHAIVFGQSKMIIRNADELHSAFSRHVESIEVHLGPGTYDLSPTAFVDSTCGNCQELQSPVHATYGLRVSGRNVRIIGPEDRSAKIVTHAGYGIFVDNCDDCIIENLTITGGERDTDGRAADAAIVVKNSSVSISSNRITQNIGDSAIVAKTIVGIMGICCRENSVASINDNEIVRNSWDGIALYRAAQATIENNIVDGIDKVRGATIGGGRGVAIGVTWNGNATIRNNLVTRYWKGIGVFVDANATVEGNIVEDILTWGISYWDADKGMPVAFIRNNVIYKTGACGASITRAHSGEETGEFVGNLIVETGQNPKYDSPDYYCYQCALALHAVPSSFLIKDNLFHNNRRATPELPDYDVPRQDFVKLSESKRRAMAAKPQFGQSVFLRDFGH